MLTLVTALFLQDPLTVTLLHDCPPEATVCARVFANWIPEHEVPEPDGEFSRDVRSEPAQRDDTQRVYRQSVLGRVDGAPAAPLELRFVTGEMTLECNDFGNSDTWAIAGWSASGTPVFLTDTGEVEILSATNFDARGDRLPVLLIDANSLEVLGERYDLMSYSQMWVYDRETVVMRVSDGAGGSPSCIVMPGGFDARSQRADDSLCDPNISAPLLEPVEPELARRALDRMGQDYPVVTALIESLGTYAVGRVQRLARDPDVLVIDPRIACT